MSFPEGTVCVKILFFFFFFLYSEYQPETQCQLTEPFIKGKTKFPLSESHYVRGQTIHCEG